METQMDVGVNGGCLGGKAPASHANATLHFADTHDVDEQAALLRGWNQSYTQMSSGAFAGSISEVRIGKIHLFLEETSKGLYQVGQLPPGVCAVGVPLTLRGPGTFCGAACDPTGLHVFSGSDEFEFQSPEGLVMAGIVVPEDMLIGHCATTEHDSLVRTLARPRLKKVHACEAKAFGEHLQSVFEVFRCSPHLAGNTQALETLTKSLVGNLLVALTDSSNADGHLTAPNKRWRIVVDARRLILENLDKPINVADICCALGISRRTLQYCFQEVLGFGPATFLRRVRLDGARRAIKREGSVTEAATMWGFWHLGRFAQEYRNMYGELPSDTFRRFRTCKTP